MPRKAGSKAGSKVTDPTKGNYWKSVDPFIPVVVQDWTPAGGENMAQNPYGKGRTAKKDQYRIKSTKKKG